MLMRLSLDKLQRDPIANLLKWKSVMPSYRYILYQDIAHNKGSIRNSLSGWGPHIQLSSRGYSVGIPGRFWNREGYCCDSAIPSIDKISTVCCASSADHGMNTCVHVRCNTHPSHNFYSALTKAEQLTL